MFCVLLISLVKGLFFKLIKIWIKNLNSLEGYGLCFVSSSEYEVI